MTVEDAHQLLQLIVKAGNQRAAARELGCSQWAISNRMTKARKLLGDAAVLAYMNSCLPEAADEKKRQRLDNKKSLHCHNCGAEKVASPTTGKLVCRPCANLNNQAYRDRVPEKIRELGEMYYATNRDLIKQKQRAYYAANRTEILSRAAAFKAANPGRDAAYYAANRERIIAKVRAYAAANKAKISEYHRLRAQTDPTFREARRARLRAWKKRHPDRVNASWHRRRAQMLRAYPAWANDELIAEAYALAQLRTRMTGIPWQVDHIVPLNNDLVCGLHWEGNLQVIPAVANLAKSNDWWPDMPDEPAGLAAFNTRPSLYLSLIGMGSRNAGKSERALQREGQGAAAGSAVGRGTEHVVRGEC